MRLRMSYDVWYRPGQSLIQPQNRLAQSQPMPAAGAFLKFIHTCLPESGE